MAVTGKTVLKQEILLGIGGMLMLKKLGIKKDIYHCNEGHAALCNLQRLCDYVDSGLSFNQAMELVRASSLIQYTLLFLQGTTISMRIYLANTWEVIHLA